MSAPTLNIFTGNESFGRVFREQSQINVKFWEANIPLSSTTGRISFNFAGKTRILMIQGATDGTGFTGSNPEDRMAQFVFKMEEWINAATQTSKVFTDSFGKAYDVDGVDFTWTRVNSDPSRVLYSLIMKEN